MVRIVTLWAMVVWMLWGGFEVAAKKPKILSPQEAFQVSALAKESDVVVTLRMGEKIYVYANSLKFRLLKPQETPLAPPLPRPIMHDEDKVYEGKLEAVFEGLLEKYSGKIELEVAFQGCSESGICYQPMTKRFEFEGLAKSGVLDKIGSALKEGNASKIAELISQESAIFIVALFFIFGVLLSLTPCIFPMIPILSSIILSQQKNAQKPNTAKAFLTSLVYVLAMALTYTAVGIVAGLIGADIQSAMQNPWVLGAFSAIFVALALSLFGYYEIALPASWQSKLSRISDNAADRGGVIGTAIMGVLSALIVGPCVAPPLAGAVLFISHSGDAILGGVALFVMSIGMGLPLLLIGVGAGKWMPKPGTWMTRVSQVFGVMMLALAIFMLSRVLPDGITLVLWALLFMGSALYMGVFEFKTGEGALRLFRLLALVFLIYGIALFVGALAGAKSMLDPFAPFKGAGGDAKVAHTASKKENRGYSVERLRAEVEASEKPVVVDFTKESCTACKELEHITFPDPRVQKELARFTFITVDVTDNTPQEQALLKHFELFGTPNIIFFDKEGNYLKDKTLTGFIDPESFANHLRTIP